MVYLLYFHHFFNFRYFSIICNELFNLPFKIHLECGIVFHETLTIKYIEFLCRYSIKYIGILIAISL
mgnify:CR=1 FL=1